MGDAFTNGVEPWGLRAPREIRVLVCYTVEAAKEAIARDSVMEIIAGQGMANFFETGEAIDSLITNGHLSENSEAMLEITETGRQIADTLSSAIPLLLRERAVRAALYATTRMRRERENTVLIEKQEMGYTVTCTMNDGNIPLLSMTLKVADKLQAQMVREKFLDDPILVYRSTIALLTGDAVVSHINSRISIDLN